MIRTIERQLAVDGNHSAAGDKDIVTNQVLVDYYRCPESLGWLVTSPRWSGEPGYFRLGKDTVCNGGLANGEVAACLNGLLLGALDHLSGQAGQIVLPFDAAEVIENLRRERYAARFRQEGRRLDGLLQKGYYSLRPLLGASTRRHVQRMRLLPGWKKIKFPHWPVDSTVEHVHRKLLALAMKARGLKQMPFIWFWPEGFSSCAIITHDVEGACGKDFCSQLMGIDEAFDFRSAFQIVPEGRYTVTEEFLGGFSNRGFEVNVHDLRHDARLFAKQEAFRQHAARINEYVRKWNSKGFRSGVLYRNADWYGAFDFSYDMSIPTVAHLDPQRGGCCTVMPFFIGRIVELPLTTTQDYTLFHILGDYSIQLWREQIALIRASHGLINILVHPDYVIDQRAQRSYRELLTHVSELRAAGEIWTPLPGEVADWWRRRRQMELAFEDEAWRVRGPGSERARVAFAELSGDEVVYTLGDPHEASRRGSNRRLKSQKRPPAMPSRA